MVRQQRTFKFHEDRYPLCHSRKTTSEHKDKDELVKHDLLTPPRYLRRTEDSRGKALSFGVLDWKQWKDTSADGAQGACCSYVETAATSLELDLSTGVVKRSELDLKPQAAASHMRNHSFSLRSLEDSYEMAADTVMRMEEMGNLAHQPLSRKQKEHKVSSNKNLAEKEHRNASDLSSCISRLANPRSETSFKLLSEALRTVECRDRRHDVQGECSSPGNVMERNQIPAEKPDLLDQDIPTVTCKKGRDASPNRRFSFSFSQMSRSFSSKESSSSSSSISHASAKSGPLTFTDSVNTTHLTRTKPNGHCRTRSGTILKSKTENNVPLHLASKLSSTRPPPTMEKKQFSSRVRALLQFTLRKGINLFQFVVENSNDVLAATMKSSNSSTRSYSLYSVKEVKNKSGNWLGRHRNEEKNHPFAHTIIGQMKTVTSVTSDLATHKSETVLISVETNEELAAIVQTTNKIQKHSSTTIIFPSGCHTLPKDCNAPLPLIERWKSGGTCDCGGWDIGCKLRVLSNYHTKSQTLPSFQLFDQERDKPALKMVTHDNELHSVEFGSSISNLEAFFISLAVSSHQTWCEEEEEAVSNRVSLLKRETSKYTPNPPVSPIGRV